MRCVVRGGATAARGERGARGGRAPPRHRRRAGRRRKGHPQPVEMPPLPPPGVWLVVAFSGWRAVAGGG